MEVAQEFEELQLVFVYREHNGVADTLAKFASSPDFAQNLYPTVINLGIVVKVWDFCPRSVSSVSFDCSNSTGCGC